MTIELAALHGLIYGLMGYFFYGAEAIRIALSPTFPIWPEWRGLRLDQGIFRDQVHRVGNAGWRKAI